MSEARQVLRFPPQLGVVIPLSVNGHDRDHGVNDYVLLKNSQIILLSDKHEVARYLTMEQEKPKEIGCKSERADNYHKLGVGNFYSNDAS